MKKRIIALLLSALLLANVTACNTAPEPNDESLFEDTDTESTGEETKEDTNTAESTMEETDTETEEEPNITLTPWEETERGKRYLYFHNNMNQNAYDQWLKAQLLQGDGSKDQIYRAYLAFWKTELTFTVENGKTLFEDETRYQAWKSYLDQWLDTAQDLLELESKMADGAEEPTFDALTSHCELVRQKVIDTKYFLYYLEFQQRALESVGSFEIPIKWSPEASLLEFDMGQKANTNESTGNSASDSETTEMKQYFNNVIDQNVYDKWLKINLSTDDRMPKAIYADYLALWKTELSFAIENGKDLFDSSDEYEQWKSLLEEWRILTQEILKIEMNILWPAQMEQLEVIIPHCQLIRQKVIDVKYFLYYREYQKKTAESTGPVEVPIKWAAKG